MTMRRWAALALGLGLVAVSVPSDAATTTGFAAWTFGGTTTAYSGTMQLPGTGYPAATWTSDSHAGQAAVISGATNWFGENTPPGQVFGSSRNRTYLNLQARVDGATPTPSTTTYTFASATPTGWGFVLGDIDADKVQVTATLPNGSAAGVGDLGFRSAFNLCDTTPRPGGCTGVQSTPTWDPATTTLNGNPTAMDTFGGTGWFVPTVPLKTLTFTFTPRNGSPVFQTWFAAVDRDVTGTVTTTTGECDLTAATVDLLDPAGTVLASTHPTADGSYSFLRVAASAGFTVRLTDLPPGCAAVGATSVPVDLSTADGTADFTVQETVIGTLTGTITDQGGDPVPGVPVDLAGPGDTGGTTTTDATGTFTITDLPPATYTATVDPPAGLEVVGGASRPVVIPANGGTVDLDFTLRPRPTTTPTPTPTPTPSPTTGTSGATPPSTGTVLPDTGGTDPWIPVTGAALLIAGAALIAVDRRRRRA